MRLTKGNRQRKRIMKAKNFKSQDFKVKCGCKVRFDNDGLIRLEFCHLHHMAADFHDVLKAIVMKSYLRPGQHEDCHVHPKLIEAGRMLLHNLKVAEA